ncbi:MAG TPA: family 10 glycosylhydrolase [Firmicutes bacterium]|nr:family 10 glycosylhydrolase [Bacillota bacterium]
MLRWEIPAYKTTLTTIYMALALVMSVMGSVAAEAAGPAPNPITPDLLFMARFDESFSADYAKGDPEPVVNGAVLVGDGKLGGAVRLDKGAYLSYSPSGNINMAGGTLMFWLKPDWNPVASESHTLISMGLGGEGRLPAYFVISQGWWETTGGAGRFYFVLDNQNRIHTSTKALLDMGGRIREWHHVAVTWSEGIGVSPSFVNIYIDGEVAARTSIPWTPTWEPVRRPTTNLIIGSDMASPLANGRWCDGLIDELYIYNRPLSAGEIAAIYKEQEADWQAAQEAKWAWLTSVLETQVPSAKRDDEGRLLENRALFDEGYSWTDPAQIPALVEKVKRAGFNVYVPCVWHGRGARWPSGSSGSSTAGAGTAGTAGTAAGTMVEPTLAMRYQALDVDPLAELIRQMHAAGIEVHPWFTVALGDAELYPQFADEGTPAGFFNVHNPAFRDFIVGLMLEVVAKYDVDGLNLDYVRTGGICTGQFCRDDYQAKFGRDLLGDLTAEAGQLKPAAHAAGRVIQWQDDAVADIIRRTSEQARRLRPGIVISVDGSPRPAEEGPAIDGRNEKMWVEAGWVDVVYIMDYNQQPAYDKWDAVRAESSRPEAYVCLLGNYDRTEFGQAVSRSGKLVADLVAYAQRKWPGNGVGLYLYSLLNEEQIEALRSGPFKEEAVTHWERDIM